MISDSEIIKACIEGSRKHQKILYERYAPKMLGICCRYFTSLDQAEDALQEGFVRVFANLKSFRGEGSFEGWIKRTIVNTTLNYFRNNKKHYFHIDLEDVGEAVPDYTFEGDRFNREDLLKLLQALPGGYRIVFNLFEIEGYSHKEIAEELGISVNTSKSQLSKAKKLLQKRVKELYTEEDFKIGYDSKK